MDKKRFLMILIMGAGIVGAASAVEVISIDINNYGNGTAYTGEAAVPGATQWIAYYTGWGIAAGSPRSANLAPTGTVQASTYAAQVWIGDPGNHGYVSGAGNGLLDDGFTKNTSRDPNLTFIGTDLFTAAADHAYGGTFDLYVYGDSAGDFYLTDANNIEFARKSVTGTTSGFVEGANYVVFNNISIADPNSVRLYYTGEINAIQLVSKKQTPKQIIHSTDPNDYTIRPTAWDVAFDTNGRTDETNYGFGSYYGPDTYPGWVAILDTGDYMEYDITIAPADQGKYNLTVRMDTTYGATTLNLFLDGNSIGSLASSTPDGPQTVGPLPLNLFSGTHTLKWQSTGYYGGNVGNIVLNYVSSITLNNCADVYTYGQQLTGDLNHDCRVTLADLVLLAAEWASNYNPF